MNLISIIIPTFNRAHLIGPTLDSITDQTYQNLECIVVDDGSTDNTPEVMADYVKRDSRIQYHHRPPEHKPGGNGARNYGFKISKGKFIMWFDSDDLMMPEKIQLQLETILKNNIDFSISAFRDFTDEILKTKYKHQRNLNQELNLSNFIKNKIFFGTVDMLANRKSIGNILFDEKYKTGQEFSFFCEYLSRKPKGIYIDKVLTSRRIHENSLEAIQGKDSDLLNRNKFRSNFHTYLLLKNILEISDKKILIKRSSIYYISIFKQKKFAIYRKELLGAIQELYCKRKMFYYTMILLSLSITERGRYYYKSLINNLF